MKIVAGALLGVATGVGCGFFLSRIPPIAEGFGHRELTAVISSEYPLVAPDDQVTFWAKALAAQFGEATKFHAALSADHLSETKLRRRIEKTVGVERWIESQIAPQLAFSPAEIESYYSQHEAEFRLPAQTHLRHIFFAAPTGSAKDIVEEKRDLASQTLAQLQRGTDFSRMAAAVSEDEATKSRGGDLGWISERRIPPEFFAAIEPLPVNAAPMMVQSRLGFHLVQILGRTPVRGVSLGEATAEITGRLAAPKRLLAVNELHRALAAAHPGADAD